METDKLATVNSSSDDLKLTPFIERSVPNNLLVISPQKAANTITVRTVQPMDFHRQAASPSVCRHLL